MRHLNRLSPRLLFVSLTLFGLLGWTRLPELRVNAGIFDHGRWFMDSYAVLASSDAWRAGIAPDTPNPYDIYRRTHKYSDWWFFLGQAGLTREDNFMVGGIWVLAFLAAAFLTVRPGTQAEAVWLSLLAMSPPVFLGIIRANNDLVIFAVLAVVPLALRVGTRARTALAIAAIALATGLKFYPAAAACVVLLVVPRRRLVETSAATFLAVGLVLVSVSAQLVRGQFHIEPEIYTFGGRIWLMDLGADVTTATWATFLLLAALALVAVWRGWVPPVSRAELPRDDQLLMTLGSALLVSCFLMGISFGYRFIFALWLGPWLWRNRRVSPFLGAALAMLPFVLWHDAILCLATAWWFPQLQQQQYDQILVAWRLVTEPITWLFMALPAGWLLAVVRSAVRSLHSPEIAEGRT